MDSGTALETSATPGPQGLGGRILRDAAIAAMRGFFWGTPALDSQACIKYGIFVWTSSELEDRRPIPNGSKPLS